MSGLGSPFHSRPRRWHRLSHWAFLSRSAPGKVHTAILTSQTRNRYPASCPGTPRARRAPEPAPGLGTATLGVLRYSRLPEPVGVTINWITFTPPLPTVILFCSLSCTFFLLQSLPPLTERCYSPREWWTVSPQFPSREDRSISTEWQRTVRHRDSLSFAKTKLSVSSLRKSLPSSFVQCPNHGERKGTLNPTSVAFFKLRVFYQPKELFFQQKRMNW